MPANFGYGSGVYAGRLLGFFYRIEIMRMPYSVFDWDVRKWQMAGFSLKKHGQ